jgi:hypothetical protein
MRLSTAFLCLVLCALGGISQSRFLVGGRRLSEDGARTVPRCLGLTSCYIVTVKVLSTDPRKLRVVRSLCKLPLDAPNTIKDQHDAKDLICMSPAGMQYSLRENFAQDLRSWTPYKCDTNHEKCS